MHGSCLQTVMHKLEFINLSLTCFSNGIPHGYVLLGVDAAKYSLAELRSDYRRGLVVAVSFCVFVMPVLLGTRYDHYITDVIYTRNSLFLPSLL